MYWGKRTIIHPPKENIKLFVYIYLSHCSEATYWEFIFRVLPTSKDVLTKDLSAYYMN